MLGALGIIVMAMTPGQVTGPNQVGRGTAIVPDVSREFRGVWVATVANIDWPSKPGLSVDSMKNELTGILDKCSELKMNAVVLQVRPSADALYKSDLEPWSWYLTGEQGKAPAGGFDPLEYAIEESHKRGIELHAWCNPYRALHPNQKGAVAKTHVSVKYPDWVKKYGTYLWMDPGEPGVQDHSFKVFMDLVERYDLDGIHIDDYFYPYPITEGGKKVDFPDSKSYGAYVSGGGTLNRGDWRRKNVDDFIERVYLGIKARKSHVKFGISPFGIYRPGVPEGIKAGIDQYDELYADALKWYQRGWCDYMTPQLYWPITQTPQAYPVLLNWWASVNTQRRHFWPGNFTSRTNPSDGNWNPKEVVDQIGLTRLQQGAGGNVHFSMKAFMNNWNGISDALKNGPYARAAIVPSTPWLDSKIPNSPALGVGKIDGGYSLEMTSSDSDFRFFLIQDNMGNVKVTSENRLEWKPLGSIIWVSAKVIDKAGNLSLAKSVRVPK